MFLHKSIKHKSDCHHPPVIAKINCRHGGYLNIYNNRDDVKFQSVSVCVWIDLCFIAPIKVYSCSSASE